MGKIGVGDGFQKPHLWKSDHSSEQAAQKGITFVACDTSDYTSHIYLKFAEQHYKDDMHSKSFYKRH